MIVCYIKVGLSWRLWLDRFKGNPNLGSMSKGELFGIERAQSDGVVARQKSPKLEVQETFMNPPRDEDEGLEETATSHLSEAETESMVFDSFFDSETGFVYMGCYLKRQGYEPEIWSSIV